MNLKSLLFITNLIMFLPLILAINSLVFNYVKVKKLEGINHTKYELQLLDNSFHSYCKDLEEITKQPFYDMSLNTQNLPFEIYNNDSSFETTQHNSYLYFNKNKTVESTFKKMLALKERIYAVIICNTNGVGRSFLKTNSMLLEHDPTHDDWFINAINKNGSPYISGIFRFENIALNTGTEDYVFSVSRALKDINSTNLLGVVSIFSSVNIFKDLLDKETFHTGERYFVIDNNQNIVFDTESILISKNVKDTDLSNKIKEAILKDEPYQLLGEDSMFILNSKVEGWKIVKIVPNKVLFKEMAFTNSMIGMVEALFFLMIMAASFILSGIISKPLHNLTNTIKEINKGDTSVQITPSGTVEVCILAETFNNAMKQLDYLINIVHATELKQKETELTLLHSQIAPHFLYNSLESIRMMAEINDDVDTAEMILLLSKMLHYSINYKLKMVTVEEELNYLKHYINLSNYRTPNKYILIEDIEPELRQSKILKLLFQPIVENAVFHAFDGNSKECVICIKGREENNNIIFSISDNGNGMTKEQLQLVNKQILGEDINQDAPMKSSSIGLRNIYERLVLYCGEGCKLFLESDEGKGTKVIIQIPKNTTIPQKDGLDT